MQVKIKRSQKLVCSPRDLGYTIIHHSQTISATTKWDSLMHL